MQEHGLRKNDTIGDWRLESRLGEGGQAVVWSVRYLKERHSPSGALKLATDSSEKARSRFQREVELLSDIQHPGVVKLRDSGLHEGFPFLVMERANTTMADVAAGKTTGTRLVGESRELVLLLLRQACEAVAHLHANKVLHRDLKPSNILLMLDPPEPMRSVVADLGLASFEEHQGQLTATHESIGTPAFRAPEYLAGPHTPRSDVYALGKTIEAVLNRTTTLRMGPGKCLRDATLTDDLWDALDRLLETACAYDPLRRFEDAVALAEALPVTVLGQRRPHEGTAPASGASNQVLTVSDRVCLAEIIGECPARHDQVPVYGLRQRTKLNDYRFSLALRRLEILGFVESSIEEDDHGYRYPALRPTAVGIAWAQRHDEDIHAAIAEIMPKPGDHDIPF